jgi:tRNA(Ile)-lysidine synthase
LSFVDALVLCCLAWRAGYFALTVDHGLRSESGKEAAQVCARIQDWPICDQLYFKMDGEKTCNSYSREGPRKTVCADDRSACRDNGISSLFLAHHINDQAETVLMRLVHGSGIDGLSV